MQFLSTRGGARATGPEAVVYGIANDGGLFVPEQIPALSREELGDMLSMDYPERAAFIFGKFFEEYEGEALLAALRTAYRKFEGGDPAPLVRMDNGMYLLELFHGPTCAFQDIPLVCFPYLLQTGAKMLGLKEKIVLPIASSGDTGKAALECFMGAEGVKVLVFYPEEGASKMQKLQLCTQDGENLNVVAVRGSFDDCQAGVKRMLRSEKVASAAREAGYRLSSANTVNFALIALQIAYFVSAYCDLITSDQIAMGDRVDFAIPTGNFGNAIACYYAKRMGLPVGTIVCASNKNNVIPEFWRTGTFETRRPFFPTMSPSMDVLIASNVERLIFELSGRNAARTAERMTALKETGRYSIATDEFKKFQADFFAGCSGEDETVECIYEFFEEYGYPMDTHTGVAMNVAQKYVEKKKDDPMSEIDPLVVVATASPYKFPQDVLYALTGNDVKDSFKGVKRILLHTAMKVPEPIKAVRYKPIRFKTCVSSDKMQEELLKFL